jgi:hypothetical protein
MSKMPKKQTLEQTRPVVELDVNTPSQLLGPQLTDHDVEVDGDGEASGPDNGRAKRFKEVWLVEDRKNARSVWTRVGTAFENADGSWNIRLSAVPVGAGRLNVRDPLPRERAVNA